MKPTLLMTKWIEVVSNRDQPREGAWGSQRTHARGPRGGAYRGDPAKWDCWVLIGPLPLL